MIIKRFFPNRWARILAWTGAAIAWTTSLLVVQASHAETAEPAPAPEEPVAIPFVTTTLAPLPEATDEGLVVLRFTPTPVPPPQVITRTVAVSGGGGGGGTTPAPSDPVPSSGS